MKGGRLIGPILTGAAVFALYCPVFVWLIRIWLDSPYYTHGFIILPISAFIAWTKRRELVRIKPSRIGAIVFAVGLVTYVSGFVWRIYWLSAFSFLIVAFGLTLYLSGTKAARSLMFPICFLIFMVPLPFLDSIALFLQSFTAFSSASIIQAIGIPVTRTGAEIRLADSAFIIGTPCSGMNTLISLLMLAALLGYILKGSIHKRVILFLLAFPIAIFANLIRIVSMLLIGYHWGAEVAITYFHDYSSLVFYLVALLLLGLIAWLFRLPLARKA